MKKSNRSMLFRLVTTLLFILGIALVCGTALGQDKEKDKDEDFMLEEIVVTAQFHAQNLQDTPIAITAVNLEMMEARNQINLSSIAEQVPSVVLIETGGAYGPGMSANIRGVGQHDFNPAFEPGVGVYIDDIYYPSLTGANFDLLDLDRVEIARGPQGVLCGRNSEGGSIKIYSQKPKDEASGSFRATFGDRNLQDFRAMSNIPLVPDTLFMRISAVSKKQDGYLKRYDYGCLFPNSGIPDLGKEQDCLSGTEGGKDYSAGRAALRWLASDAAEVNITADISMDNSEVAAVTLQNALSPAEQLALYGRNTGTTYTTTYGVEYGKAFVPSDPYTSYSSYTAVQPDGRTVTFAPTSRTKVWGTNLTVDWTITDSLAIKSITAYREFDSKWVSDNDVSPLGGSLGDNYLFNDSFSEELRLNGVAFNEAVNYTFGAYYFDETTTYRTHQILNYSRPGFEFRGNDPVDASSYAGFFNTSWHVTDALGVNLGVRYTHEEKDYKYGREAVSGSVTLGIDALNDTVGAYEGDKVDYRINVDYRFTDQVTVYASVSTAFKGGGTNARPFFVSQVVPFDREDLTAYEVGAKTDWLDKRLRLNASLFFNDYKDIQLTVGSCNSISPFPGAPCAATFNAGDAEVKGGELELVAAPIEGLLFDLSFSKLNFEYTRVNPDTGLKVGDNARNVIDTKYSLGVQYDIFLANGSTITPRLDYAYQGDFHTEAIFADSNLVKGYGLLNGRLSWKSPGADWEVALIGLNLTDKEYYLTNLDQLSSQGTQYGIIGAPREFAVQIKKNF
jgi:iron complex outermembrane receptor protein